MAVLDGRVPGDWVMDGPEGMRLEGRGGPVDTALESWCPAWEDRTEAACRVDVPGWGTSRGAGGTMTGGRRGEREDSWPGVVDMVDRLGRS